MNSVTIILAVLILLVIFAFVFIYKAMNLQRKKDLERLQSIRSTEKKENKNAKLTAAEKRLREKAMSNQDTASLLSRLEDELFTAGLAGKEFMLLLVWAGLIIGLPLLARLLGKSLGVQVLGLIAGLIGPVVYIKICKQRRLEKLERQLTSAIGIIINAMRAGYTFTQSLRTISREMDAPASEEFERVFNETQYGLSVAEAMSNMADRLNSADIKLLQTVVSVQSGTGGNMTEVLQTIINTINTRHELREETKSKTASGRLSSIVVGVMPVILLLIIQVLNPGYVQMFFEPGLGRILLIAAAVLEAIGFWLIYRITDIKY